MNDVAPTKIFHLAAQSNVKQSFQTPVETFQTNIFGTLNLLESVRSSKIDPIIQISSSSEVYGKIVDTQHPIKETHSFYPVSPYAISKIAVDRLGYQYFESYGLKTIITRAFPHTGPKRPSVFAESSFAKQLVEIENGKNNEILVGNLDSMRSFLDVRDMVEAYWICTEKCDFGQVYNVGSETSVTMKELLDKLVSLSSVSPSIKFDKTLLRPNDTSFHIPDIAKFKTKTNWKPKIPLEKTLNDLLEFWRQSVR